VTGKVHEKEIRAAMRDADKILNGNQALEAHEQDNKVRDKAFFIKYINQIILL
jgi:hypothetical protein